MAKVCVADKTDVSINATVSQDSVPSLMWHQPCWNLTITEHVPMQGATSAVVHMYMLSTCGNFQCMKWQ